MSSRVAAFVALFTLPALAACSPGPDEQPVAPTGRVANDSTAAAPVPAATQTAAPALPVVTVPTDDRWTAAAMVNGSSRFQVTVHDVPAAGGEAVQVLAADLTRDPCAGGGWFLLTASPSQSVRRPIAFSASPGPGDPVGLPRLDDVIAHTPCDLLERVGEQVTVTNVEGATLTAVPIPYSALEQGDVARIEVHTGATAGTELQVTMRDGSVLLVRWTSA